MKYRLLSSSFLYAPGINRWWMNSQPSDYSPDFANRLFRIGLASTAYPDAPAGVLVKLIDGEFEEQEDHLVIEYEPLDRTCVGGEA